MLAYTPPFHMSSLGIVRLALTCALFSVAAAVMELYTHFLYLVQSLTVDIATLSSRACFNFFSFRHCSLRLHVPVTLVRPLICSKSDVFSFVAVVCEKVNHNRQPPV